MGLRRRLKDTDNLKIGNFLKKLLKFHRTRGHCVSNLSCITLKIVFSALEYYSQLHESICNTLRNVLEVQETA